jgi:hypothetical protein
MPPHITSVTTPDAPSDRVEYGPQGTRSYAPTCRDYGSRESAPDYIKRANHGR